MHKYKIENEYENLDFSLCFSFDVAVNAKLISG
jgi:hypothetical protein